MGSLVHDDRGVSRVAKFPGARDCILQRSKPVDQPDRLGLGAGEDPAIRRNLQLLLILDLQISSSLPVVEYSLLPDGWISRVPARMIVGPPSDGRAANDD